MNRRNLIRTSLMAAPFFAAGRQVTAVDAVTRRKFTVDLVPGAVGIGAKPDRLIDLAADNGFESIQPNPKFLASLDKGQRTDFVANMRERGLVWGAAAMPVDFRSDEVAFRSGMKELPALAAALQDGGASRIGTWIKPFHDSLTYLANFRQHAGRLREVSKVLGDHGLRFGLEYVGTRTLWTSSRYSFVHTMAGAKELISEIGQPNVGFILDSWHWFTAGETAEDILTLRNEDIVVCDLNDAPTGIPVEEQLDNQRELPAATGVIDTNTFLQSLAKVGYDGPVRAEPFNQPLLKLDDAPAAKATGDAIRKAIQLAGLSRE